MTYPNLSARSAPAVLLLLIFSLFGSSNSVAQLPQLVTRTLSTKSHDPSPLARDFWFTMAQNYDAGGGNGKYYMLYVSSLKATKVNVQIADGSRRTFALSPKQPLAFQIPLEWEVTTSGIIENKVIHVWSVDADLSAYELSRNPFTADGMYLIPATGWGKEYVVAAYASLFESSFDYPSEFSVAANQDNTIIQVTPSMDIRKNLQPSVTLHVRHQPFFDTLTHIACVQYQLIQAQNPDDYDVTGSVVKANVPVGVVGASQCPNIPADYPYCDHICDMIPPVRTWGTNYYSGPFALRKGGDSFVIIGSDSAQTVYRQDGSGTRSYFLSSRYEHASDPAIDQAARWYSNKPFLLAQYINSTTWPGNGVSNNNIGDPAMVVLNSVEQYTRSLVIQTPTILGGQSSFTNYITLALPKGAETTTFFDDKLLDTSKWSKHRVDTSFSVWQLSGASQGPHTLNSGLPIGCYLYGYGSYDSYAWSGRLGTSTFNSPDSVAPVVSATGICFCTSITVKDSGAGQTGISSIVSDSLSNFYYQLDPTFIPGSGAPRSGYDLCIIDSSIPGYAAFSAYDLAGNHTTIVSEYSPHVWTITPTVANFGSVLVSSTRTIYDTITNQGQVSVSLATLNLSNGSRGFVIDSIDRSTLQPGERRLVKLTFTPIHLYTVFDTLLLNESCFSQWSILVGNGGTTDFSISNADFGCLHVGDSLIDSTARLINLSFITIKIDSIWVDDPQHFTYVGTLPLRLPGHSQSFISLPWKFKPDTLRPRYATQAHYRDSLGVIRNDSLFGCSIPKLGVASSSAPNEASTAASKWLADPNGSEILLLPVRPNPAGTGAEVTFTLGLRTRDAITLKLYDLLGKEQALILEDLYHPEGIFDVHFSTRKLASGTYIYRLEANHEVRSGRLVIQR